MRKSSCCGWSLRYPSPEDLGVEGPILSWRGHLAVTGPGGLWLQQLANCDDFGGEY